MQLSIIIVNYNVKYFLEQCICATLKACKDIVVEIFVVDNASTDGSKDYFQNRFPEVQFIWLNENIGFGRANNLALAKSKGKHILFLNPDTIIPENSLSQFLDFFDENKNCGAAGVRMISGSGSFLKESKRNTPTPKNSFYKISGLAALFPSSDKLSGYYANHVDEKSVGAVEVLAGACMMLCRKAADATSGFDPDFFMYGEDVDLSYRVRQAGMINCYVGNITILHFKGESSLKNNYNHLRNFYGAMSLFVHKHYGKKGINSKLLQWGIRAGALKSKWMPKKHNEEKMNKSLAILGTAAQYQTIAPQLQSIATNVFHIPVYDDMDNKFLTEVFEDKMKATGTSNVLFCEGVVTNKTIIELVSNSATKYNYYYHQSGSKSIVGSNSPDCTGFTLQLT